MSIGTFLHKCLVEAQAIIHKTAELFGAAQPILDALAKDAMPMIRAIDPNAAAYADLAIKIFDGAAAVARNADGTITVTHTVEIAEEIQRLVKESKDWIGTATTPPKP